MPRKKHRGLDARRVQSLAVEANWLLVFVAFTGEEVAYSCLET